MKRVFFTILLMAFASSLLADIFTLKPELAGIHPRILFTQAEADSLSTIAQAKLAADYNTMISDCKSTPYPTNTGSSTWGQSLWWRMTRLAIAAALSKDPEIIDSCKAWLNRLDTDANFSAVDLNPAHMIGGYAIGSSLVAEHKAVAQDIVYHSADIIGGDIIATLKPRMGAGAFVETDAATWAGADLYPGF